LAARGEGTNLTEYMMISARFVVTQDFHGKRCPRVSFLIAPDGKHVQPSCPVARCCSIVFPRPRGLERHGAATHEDQSRTAKQQFGSSLI
jgi:hypothetical protein